MFLLILHLHDIYYMLYIIKYDCLFVMILYIPTIKGLNQSRFLFYFVFKKYYFANNLPDFTDYWRLKF